MNNSFFISLYGVQFILLYAFDLGQFSESIVYELRIGIGFAVFKDRFIINQVIFEVADYEMFLILQNENGRFIMAEIILII